MKPFDKRQWHQWQTQAQMLVNRSLDRHLRLAVTGLSRSGKTAFITALVNSWNRLDSRLGYLIGRWCRVDACWE